MSEQAVEYIKIQWADIHHSRQQEWKVLTVIAGVFYVIVQVDPQDLEARVFLGLLAILSSFFGACISWQHYTIFLQKIDVISRLERQIGIQYPGRRVRLSVQVLLFLLFGSITSAFVGITFRYLAQALDYIYLLTWAYAVGAAVFFFGFLSYALFARRNGLRAKSYDYAHPFYAEISDLEQCLALLGNIPLKLVVGETLDRPSVREVSWESPAWAFERDDDLITKPVLLNRRDVFQFSLANAVSKQNCHSHEHVFEVCVSDHPMELAYYEKDDDQVHKVHVNRGVLFVPPGVTHRLRLSGNAFVFQATLAGYALGQDKDICPRELESRLSEALAEN